MENRTLRQAVRRNIEKFPDDFLYKLSEDESNEVILRGVSQSVIPPGYNTGGMQMYAFTEQGVAMLSTVLKSANATVVSVDVVLDKLEELSPAVTTEQLFPSGCVWDAYTFVCDLIRSAEHRIVLVDNYVDERVLCRCPMPCTTAT